MPIRTYSFLQGNIPAEKGNGGVIIAFLHTAVTDLIGKYRSAALKDLTTILKCNKHTSATILLSENVNIETVSRRLGHNNASTTLNIYGHAMPVKDADAASVLGKLITPS